MPAPKNRHDLLRSQDFLVMFAAVLFFAFMLALGVYLGIPKAGENALALTSPAFYPYLVCCFGLIVSGFGLAAAVLGSSTVPALEEEVYSPLKASIRFFAILALFALYYLLLPILGALISSVAIFAGLLVLGGERRVEVIAGASAGIPLVAYLIFSNLARVPLPVGPFPF